MRHDIFLTVAQFENHIHMVLDCGCGEVLKEMDFDMLAISLDTLDNAKWKHLAEANPLKHNAIAHHRDPWYCENADCIGHIEPEEL